MRPGRLSAIFISLVLALTTHLSYARVSAAPSPVINVLQHGVKINSDTAVGPAIETLMEDYSDATLYFPAGNYLLANNNVSKTGLIINSRFHGALVFAAGAAFTCNTSDTSAGTCIHLIDASNVLLQSVRIKYTNQQKIALKRKEATGYALLIDSSTRIRLLHTAIEASPGVCFWASNSDGLSIDDIHVEHCIADGVHFENDRNVTLHDMWSNNTLDDGLAFTNLAPVHPNCGASATSIHIKDSATRGIAVPGGCDVEVRDFAIERTGVSGVLVNTDTYFHMRRPDRVSFRDGVITNAGTLASSSGGGNKFGIEISAADHVSITNVRVVSSAGRGFDVSHGSTFITLAGSTISGAGDSAIDLQNSSNITLADDNIDTSAGYGTYLSGVSNYQGDRLTYKNVFTTRSRGNLHRVFWVDDSAGPTHQDALKILDDQAVSTGYVVGCSNTGTYPFSITNLSANIHAGHLEVECDRDVSQ